jgi:hypothetical protein
MLLVFVAHGDAIALVVPATDDEAVCGLGPKPCSKQHSMQKSTAGKDSTAYVGERRDTVVLLVAKRM